MIVLFCLNEYNVVVCLRKQYTLVLDEGVESAIEYAAEHGWINTVMHICCEQLHIDRNGELVTYDLTRFMANGATIEVDANPLAIEEVHFCLSRNTNATMCSERR